MRLEAPSPIQKRMRRLLDSIIVYNDHITVKLKSGISLNVSKNKNGQRYWKDVFSSGTQRLLMFSQWFRAGTNYGAHKDDFIRWYGTL